MWFEGPFGRSCICSHAAGLRHDVHDVPSSRCAAADATRSVAARPKWIVHGGGVPSACDRRRRSRSRSPERSRGSDDRDAVKRFAERRSGLRRRRTSPAMPTRRAHPPGWDDGRRNLGRLRNEGEGIDAYYPPRPDNGCTSSDRPTKTFSARVASWSLLARVRRCSSELRLSCAGTSNDHLAQSRGNHRRYGYALQSVV